MSYGISITTLEEVFLKISNPELSEEEKKEQEKYLKEVDN